MDSVCVCGVGGGGWGYLKDAGGDGDHLGEMGDGGAETLLEVAEEEQSAARGHAAHAGGGHSRGGGTRGWGARPSPRERGARRSHVTLPRLTAT